MNYTELQRTMSKILVTISAASVQCFLLEFPAAGATARQDSNPPVKVIVQDGPIDRSVRAPISFAPIAKKVAPSVVNIYSTMTIKERPDTFMDEPFLRRFFGDEFGQAEPRERKAQGLGSGVIVSQDGYILTANHVIEAADKVKVSLSSGDKEFVAKVIGADPPTDIAVLKLEGKTGLPAATLADSDKLEVGDMVLAVGNPFGVGQTLTLGIVSALSRGGFGINGYEDFIQTDAAINPGNSGGALVDVEGRLVGINTAILSRSGGFQGVGFAVPINMARYVMDRLIASGKVSRGYLGINIQPLTSELAKEFNLPDESSGVVVGGVAPNSAAAKAGLQEGDVIIELNGKKIVEPRVLQLQVAQAAPGSKVTLRVLRPEPNGKPTQKTVSAILCELPADVFAMQGRNSENDEGGKQNMDALEGVGVTDIDQAARRQLNIPRTLRGALVAKVAASSNAAEAGLRQGDVILEINRQPVHSADDAVALSNKVKGGRGLLRVWSWAAGGAGTRYVVVDNSHNK